MRRQHKRQPLVTVDIDQNNVKNIVLEEEERDEVETPDLGAPNNAPLPYVVPPNETSNNIYVPLIKNVIKKEELMWKDGYDFTRILENDTWLQYANAGMDLTKEKAGVTADGIWTAEPYLISNGLDLASGRCIPDTILGDGVLVKGMEAGGTLSPYSDNYGIKNPIFTITDSMTIVFSGLSWGYAFLLRLIDDRIENAAGKDDPQVVCYSPTTHIIKVTCQGWYNTQTQDGSANGGVPLYYNLCMKGEVDLLYDWNKLNSGKSFVLLVTNRETYKA